MQFFEAFLFACSANLDNMTIGITYGIRKIRIPFLYNVIIALVSCAGTFLAMTLGSFAAHSLAPKYAQTIGNLLLIFLGLYFLWDGIRPISPKETAAKNTNAQSPAASPSALSLSQTLLIACALTLNNLGMGISASIAGLPSVLTSCCTFFVSIAMLCLGQYLGKTYLAKILGHYAEAISGCILLILGIFEFI